MTTSPLLVSPRIELRWSLDRMDRDPSPLSGMPPQAKRFRDSSLTRERDLSRLLASLPAEDSSLSFAMTTITLCTFTRSKTAPLFTWKRVVLTPSSMFAGPRRTDNKNSSLQERSTSSGGGLKSRRLRRVSTLATESLLPTLAVPSMMREPLTQEVPTLEFMFGKIELSRKLIRFTTREWFQPSPIRTERSTQVARTSRSLSLTLHPEKPKEPSRLIIS